MRRVLCIVIQIVFLSSCTRVAFPKPEKALRLTMPLEVRDDLGMQNLRAALLEQITFFTKHPCAKREMKFGRRVVICEDYQLELAKLAEFLDQQPSSQQFDEYIRMHFDFYEVYGRKHWGNVLTTAYFEPLIHGERVKKPPYTQALYSTPEDLLYLDPKIYKDEGNKLRVRVEDKEIKPYFSRQEIDQYGKISATANVLAWVDPIDAFFLQIQGSGTVEFPDHTSLILSYAEKNGHPYVALGNVLKSKIAEKEITMTSIREYLRSLSISELQEVLNTNPSYVFFNSASEHAVTSMGIPAWEGRTIASDSRYFPKGALAFLHIPNFLKETDLTRFVLDQDVGGAIKGPGRIDLFLGRGAKTGEIAGAVKSEAYLYYLLPKTENIEFNWASPSADY